MAGIKIEDLPESLELDTAAMSQIYGGARSPLPLQLERRQRRQLAERSLFFDHNKRRGRSR